MKICENSEGKFSFCPLEARPFICGAFPSFLFFHPMPPAVTWQNLRAFPVVSFSYSRGCREATYTPHFSSLHDGRDAGDNRAVEDDDARNERV